MWTCLFFILTQNLINALLENYECFYEVNYFAFFWSKLNNFKNFFTEGIIFEITNKCTSITKLFLYHSNYTHVKKLFVLLKYLSKY